MKSLKKSSEDKGRGPRTEFWGMLMGKDWVKYINQERVIRREGGELRGLLGFLGAKVQMIQGRNAQQNLM